MSKKQASFASSSAARCCPHGERSVSPRQPGRLVARIDSCAQYAAALSSCNESGGRVALAPAAAADAAAASSSSVQRAPAASASQQQQQQSRPAAARSSLATLLASTAARAPALSSSGSRSGSRSGSGSAVQCSTQQMIIEISDSDPEDCVIEVYRRAMAAPSHKSGRKVHGQKRRGAHADSDGIDMIDINAEDGDNNDAAAAAAASAPPSKMSKISEGARAAHAADSQAPAARADAPKGRRGRPPGSKNKPKSSIDGPPRVASDHAAAAAAHPAAAVPHIPPPPGAIQQQPEAAVHPLLGPAVAIMAARSIAQACPSDWLQLIFAYLPLSSLHAVLLSCRAWCAAACVGPRTKSRGLTMCINTTPALESFLKDYSKPPSPSLRLHVTSLELASEQEDHRTGAQMLTGPPMLSRLRKIMPHLTALNVRVSEVAILRQLQKNAKARDRFVHAAFPPLLTSLTLRFGWAGSRYDPAAVEGDQPLLDVLKSTPMLVRLTIEFARNSMKESQVDLAPLMTLQQLTHLTYGKQALTLSQIAVIKQLSALRVLRYPALHPWPPHLLESLCRPPHASLLEQIDLGTTVVSVAEMSALVHLPSLTHLCPKHLQPEAYPMLARLPRLRSLSLTMELDRQPSAAEQQSLLAALSSLKQLHTVHVGSWETDASMSAFLPQLLIVVPSLRILTLHSVSLSSLEFLAHAPRLQHLRLQDLPQPLLPAEEVLRIGRGRWAPKLHHLELLRATVLTQKQRTKITKRIGLLKYKL